MERLLTMLLSRFLNRLINRGINSGINRALGDKTATPAQRDQSRVAREALRRGRQAAAILRRLR